MEYAEILTKATMQSLPTQRLNSLGVFK